MIKVKFAVLLFFAILLLPTVGGRVAFGFAEDSAIDGVMKSSVHYDTVMAFGRCLGYPPDVAQTIADYSQATDSLQFQSAELNFTARPSINMNHFHIISPEILRPRAWLRRLLDWSETPNTVLNLPLKSPQVPRIAGTPMAFGVYLHVLGDRFSHRACTDIVGETTHCVAGGSPQRRPCEDDEDFVFCGIDHQLEFGRNPVLTRNTKEGLRQIYSAMAQRQGKPGDIPPSIEAFIQNFATSPQPQERVQLANSLCNN
jgi:hypothetical protein